MFLSRDDWDLGVAVQTHPGVRRILTFGKMGPTEFRLIVILLTMIYQFFPSVHNYTKITTFLGKPIVWGMFDYFIAGVFVILTIIYLVTLVKDGIAFSKADPLPKRKQD